MKLKNPQRWFWVTDYFYRIFRSGIKTCVIPTNRCPMHCDYCPMFVYGEPRKAEECTVAEWKTFLKRVNKNHRIFRTYMSGGEPGLYKDIVPLINFCIERGQQVIVQTNLWKPEAFKGIKPHHRLLFMATYHEAEETRLKRTVEKFKNSVEWMREQGFQIVSQSLLENNHGFDRIKEFFTIDWFKNMDNVFAMPPDAPRTLGLFVGSTNTYKK